MRKKSVAILMCLALAMAVSGCGEKTSQGGGQPAAAQTQTAGGEAQAAAEVEGLKEAIAEAPVLLTSVGQSADYEMVKTMLDKNNIKCEKNSLATSADLEGIKTLMLAVGGSSKGLGAAGIDANGELERVAELIGAADEQGIVIIAVHVGGEARRGDLSDKFIAPSFEKADYAIVVADGDKDGLMKGLAAQAGIPFDEVSSMADVVPKLGAAFKS
ncbi:DUF6305 family protein [Clostridium transplantifaecale]|uniref:DUF6305 family protein n=1 Tax=Clostridium transplantifaecale TaxID=2479838 RepID=UPI000F63E0B3|nr:DUF6305 family protein [Clostridium transplantifaecale]